MSIGVKFPDRHSTVSAYEQMQSLNMPMFAYDIDETARKGYVCCDWTTFVTSYYKGITLSCKNVYEVLREGEPLKFFLDLEAMICDDRVYDPICDRVVEKVLVLSEELFNYRPPHIVLDASNEGKFSKHVIFGLFLEDMNSCKSLMELLRQSLDEEELGIVDQAVYTKNRLFRLLYSSKFNVPNRRLRVVGKGDEYDEVDMLDSLVGYYVKRGTKEMEDLRIHWVDEMYGPPFRLTYDVPKKEVSRRSGGSRNGITNESVSGWMSTEPPTKLSKFLDMLGVEVLSSKEQSNGDERFFSFILKGLECPWKGDEHASNNQFLFIDPRGVGKFQCSDPDCLKIYYSQYDFSRVLQ